MRTPTMRTRFIKMHGLGNDFVVLDAREQDMPEISERFARAIADRKTGIGCDQLILLEESDEADLGMRIFNADGGEVEACGNATRAIGLLLGKPTSITTSGGMLKVSPFDGGAEVEMGTPRFEWDVIPLDHAMDTQRMPVGWEDLEAPSAVNVGNPHVIFFVPAAADIELERLGPIVENDPLFPNRVNVNVADIEDGRINLRVWERGVGETRACGTGACATAVAAIRNKLVESPVEVQLAGGTLTIDWDREGPIRMSGPAAESYRGSFDWEQFA